MPLRYDPTTEHQNNARPGGCQAVATARSGDAVEMSAPVAEIVAEFALRPTNIEPLGSAGGFSGASFWRLHATQGTFCLRRWPTEHPSAEQLRFIHSMLQRAANRGITFLPDPLHTVRGMTFVERQGRLWEVAPWLPGAADFHDRPSVERLAAAAEAVARLHVALADEHPTWAPSPSVRERIEQGNRLLADAPHIAQKLHECPWHEFTAPATRIWHLALPRLPGLVSRLAAVRDQCFRLQPVVRDVWHQHVLFEGDQVTGIIDFGAMRTDSVTVDLARMLGSLAGENRNWWQLALERYQQIRPLATTELPLLDLLADSTTLLAGLNWIVWICVEQRTFDNRGMVLRRIDEITSRLDQFYHNSPQ